MNLGTLAKGNANVEDTREEKWKEPDTAAEPLD